MDDLDDDLFNTLLSSRPKSKAREGNSAPVRRPNSVEKLLHGAEADDDDIPDLGLTEDAIPPAITDVAKSTETKKNSEEEDDFDFNSKYVPSSSTSRRQQTAKRIMNVDTESDLFPASGSKEMRETDISANRNKKETDEWLGIFGSSDLGSAKETDAIITNVTDKRNPDWLSPDTNARIRPRSGEQKVKAPESPVVAATRSTPKLLEQAEPDRDVDTSESRVTLRKIQELHAHELQEMTASHGRHVQMIEESNSRRESRVRAEMAELYEELSRQRRRWCEEREELVIAWSKRLKTAENTHMQDVETVTELHRESLAEVKRQLSRNRADLENVAPFARSLNGLIEQLEKVVADLGKVANRALGEKLNRENTTTTYPLEDGAELKLDLERKQQLIVAERLKLGSERAAFEEEKRLTSMRNSTVDPEIIELRRSLEKEREDWREKTAAVRHLRSRLERKGEELERERARLEEWARTLRELAAETERSQRESVTMRENGVVALNSAKELWLEFCSRSKMLGQREIRLAQDEARFSVKKSGSVQIGESTMPT